MLFLDIDQREIVLLNLAKTNPLVPLTVTA